MVLKGLPYAFFNVFMGCTPVGIDYSNHIAKRKSQDSNEGDTNIIWLLSIHVTVVQGKNAPDFEASPLEDSLGPRVEGGNIHCEEPGVELATLGSRQGIDPMA